MPTRRRRAAGLITLLCGLLLSSCGVPRAQDPARRSPGPATASPGDRPERPGQPGGAGSSGPNTGDPQTTQRRALAEAADLFNRGENDLACEQVRRAQQAASPAAAKLAEQLTRFRQACEER